MARSAIAELERPVLNRLAHLAGDGLVTAQAELARFGSEGYLLDNLDAIHLKPADFLGIVRQYAYVPQTQVAANLGPDSVIALVRGKPELQIGVNRIQALLLKLVSLDLGREADAPPFLAHVNNHSAARFGHLAHRLV